MFVIVSKGSGTGMVEGLNTNGKTVFYEGTEGLLVREFCKVRNCTLKVKPRKLLLAYELMFK